MMLFPLKVIKVHDLHRFAVTQGLEVTNTVNLRKCTKKVVVFDKVKDVEKMYM